MLVCLMAGYLAAYSVESKAHLMANWKVVNLAAKLVVSKAHTKAN